MARQRIKPIPEFITGDAKHPWKGINTTIQDIRFLSRGQSYDEMNWVTGRDQDNIQLRRGSALLSKDRTNIPGASISGLGIGIKNDGTQIPFFSYLQKILYFNTSTGDPTEIGSNLLPVAASGENFNFMPYQNLAGAYLYGTSKHSSIYKFSLANLGSYLDLSEGIMGVATISLANPAVIGFANHGLVAGDTVQFSTTGTLPAPIYPGVTYYVIASGLMTDSFEISETSGGSAIDTSAGSQTGVQTLIRVTDVLDFHFNFAKINRGYMFGMNRSGATSNSNDVTGLYLSVPDEIADNTPAPLSGEGIGTGDGTTRTFSGTLPLMFPNTVYFVQITDIQETFIDDKNGHLLGSLGGIGTINYITGAYSVTFNTAPASGQVITATWYQENSTNGGVADFTGDGSDIFRQDDGGGIAMAVWAYQGVEYCFHQIRSWLLSIDASVSPIEFDNEPYYEQIGLPNSLAVYPTGDGIIFLNNANPGQPTVSELEIPPGSITTTVVPVSISQDLNLQGYTFDKCVVFRWYDYNIVSFKSNVNGLPNPENDVTFVQNIYSKDGCWNQLDYSISCLAEYNGTLLSGDSLSPNLFTLFSGFDDDEEVIANYWKEGYHNLDIDGLKKVGYLNFSGLIQSSQILNVFISLDEGEYVQVGTIYGNGSYVSENSYAVGSHTVGSIPVGGGNGSGTVFANEFEIDIPVHTDKFEYISWMVQAVSVGYVQINLQKWKDIRLKRSRILRYNSPEINEPTS